MERMRDGRESMRVASHFERMRGRMRENERENERERERE